MAAPRRVDVAERRARLGRRHALVEPVTTAEEAAAAVVALHASDPVSVHLSAAARTGAPDVTDAERADPWVALLPGLDPTTMGWKGRDWYLGDLGPRLFDRNGNAGPTVWVDGRVVGGWGQRRDGSIAVELLVDPGSSAATAVAAAVERLEGWFAGTVVTPRFRTPLERELSA